MRLKYDLSAFDEIRREPSRALREEYGRKILAIAGEGYEMRASSGRSRDRLNVYAATAAAKRDNARNNTLVRALGSV